MNRKWCVREDIFEKDDGLWWLNKEQNDRIEKSRTPMTIALRNGGISEVIDAKADGLLSSRKRGIF